MKNTLKQILLIAALVPVTSVHAIDKAKQLADTVTKTATTGVCNLYGTSSDLAAISNKLVPGLENAAKRSCCKLSAFVERNPNTVRKALGGCKGIEADNKLAVEDACGFVSLAGDYLNKAPDAVKAKLGSVCCKHTSVMKDNPKAAKAMGCPAA